MPDVTIRELRNHGGDVIERVVAGEVLTVTRDGRPVARLQPVPFAALAAEVVVARRRRLPLVDPIEMRVDIDRAVDSSL